MVPTALSKRVLLAWFADRPNNRLVQTALRAAAQPGVTPSATHSWNAREFCDQGKPTDLQGLE